MSFSLPLEPGDTHIVHLSHWLGGPVKAGSLSSGSPLNCSSSKVWPFYPSQAPCPSSWSRWLCFGGAPLEAVCLSSGAVLTHMRFLRSHRARRCGCRGACFHLTLCAACSPRGLAAWVARTRCQLSSSPPHVLPTSLRGVHSWIPGSSL